MTKKEIIDYVTETPHNVNKSILSQQLDQYGIGGGSAEPDMVITVEKDSFNAGDYSEIAVIESGSVENVVAKVLSGQIPVIVYKHDKVYSGVRYIYACVAQAYTVAGNTLNTCSFIQGTRIIHVDFNHDGTLDKVFVSDIQC